MTMTDANGRPYAKVATLKAGDHVTVDGGFTCMKEGTRKQVHRQAGRLKGWGYKYGKPGESERLYIKCRCGQHGLSGQVEGKIYLGIYPA